MELVAIIIVLALIQYSVLGALVGKARGQYGVEAPAVHGHPVFERYYRVHQNTLENLVMFIPGMVLFGLYAWPEVAAALGVVYLVGRQVYLQAYVRDPKSRALGFMLSFLPTVLLILGGLIGATMSLVA